MLDGRNLINVACVVCATIWVGCSTDDGASPPASRGVMPPSAANASPPAAVGPEAAGSGANVARLPTPTTPAPSKPTDAPSPAVDPRSGVPIGPEAPPDPNGQKFVRVIPTDDREVRLTPNLPPISGGTLAVSRDDRFAIVADPDRDRVSIVDLFLQAVSATVALQAGDEPGRIAVDGAGRAHVALRRGGAVASIDIATGRLLERRAVCGTPRGIAHDSTGDKLLVACASGELVTLPASGAGTIERKHVEADLRDVVVREGSTYLTRLKSAELFPIDAAGARGAVTRPNELQEFFPDLDGALVADAVQPLGARRTIATADGLLMLHAGGRTGDIPVQDSEEGTTNPTGGSPYGGGSHGCSGVIGTQVTQFDEDGRVVTTARMPGVLAVDVAQSSATGELAVAFAGAADPTQPVGGLVLESELESVMSGIASQPAIKIDPATGRPVELGTTVLSVARFDPAAGIDLKHPSIKTCVPFSDVVQTASPATAVTFMSDGRLLVQTRDPATLVLTNKARDPNGSTSLVIDLGGVSVFDTGHEIFHRDAGAGVACASCHIEGGDDGHTWNFVDMGPRRTQSIHVGLEGTEPFHWIGDMRDLPTLMEHVFVGRMGGVHQTPQRLNALASWMYSVRAPAPPRAAADPAVERGRQLFVGQAECAQCHAGAKLTNNETVDVGTGLELQVPSLVAVAYRGPWIHNGCATTLRDRFDPACGGANHGRTAQLTPVQLDDLVAYLESL